MSNTPTPPSSSSTFLAPINLPKKRKSTPLEPVVLPPKRKREVIEENEFSSNTPASNDKTSGQKRQRAKKEKDPSSTTTKRKAPIKRAPKEVEQVPPPTMDKLNYGVTRRQRHTMLEMFLKAANLHKNGGDDNVATDDNNEKMVDYMKRLEQRIYDGIFGSKLHIAFNLYRGEVYRKVGFEILWALRKHAPYLMETYTPELLASLPPRLLIQNTTLAKDFNAWKHRQDFEAEIERDTRATKKSEKGEGWLKCHRCEGKFDIRMVQMRGGDEPATIFMTCLNCNYVKRKG